MAKLTKIQQDFIIQHRDLLLHRVFALNLFAVVTNRRRVSITQDDMRTLEDRGWVVVQVAEKLDDSVGIIETVSGKSRNVVGYEKDNVNAALRLVYLSPVSARPIDFIDTVTVTSEDLANIPGKDPLTITVGQYLVNYAVLVDPFGSLIPFTPTASVILKHTSTVANGLLEGTITVEQYNRYVNNLFLLESYSELSVPTASWKGLTTHPDVQKTKAALLKKYEGRLNDPMVAKIVEDQLQALDNQHIKGDPIERFIDPLGSKGRDIHRKKLLLTVGGIEAFDDTPGQYSFIANSLAEGWDPKTFPDIVDEIRKGSYNRGKETELGGMQTKFAMRIFSDVQVTEDDCGTTEGMLIELTPGIAKKFLNRYIVVRGQSVELTEGVLKDHIGKTVVLRSPMTCKTKPGWCYKCVGRTFEKVSVRGISMLVVDVTSTFTLFSMKNMHGTKIATRDLSQDFASFFV